jgi:hypothetical protein
LQIAAFAGDQDGDAGGRACHGAARKEGFDVGGYNK